MMGFIKRFMDGRQKGFTLVELLTTMLLTALIGTSLVVLVTQMYAIPNHNSAHLTAVMQVDNAVDTITRDVMQAQTISVTTSGDFLYMTWTDYGTGNSYQVTYIINSTNKTLTRSQNGGTATLVATYIDPSTSCTLTGNTLALNMISTVGGQKPASETRQVQIVRRPT